LSRRFHTANRCQVDARALYTTLAARHRPDDPAAVAAEIRRLRGTGLGAHAIGTVLQLDLAVVIDALREPRPVLNPTATGDVP
jgi:hypothetical protein